MQISLVVPVYCSADCLPELAHRVSQELAGRFESFELVLVNDDSPDKTWAVIQQLVLEYPFIIGVNLRKNVGQDNAIMAGLHQASGDTVVIMDDDLQHDPADIPKLHSELQCGFDVVYAFFGAKEQAWWKNLGSWFNDRVAVVVLQKPKNIYLSPYKAIRREVVDEILKYQGPFSYVDGLLFTVTSNITQVPVEHHARFAGQSNYGLLRSIRVWLKLATSFSVIPLRIVSITGGLIALFSFLMGGFFIFQALTIERPVEGWPSLIVSLFFLGGIQLAGLGALGEYIGRIYMTLNRRPQFTVQSVLGSKGNERSADG